MKNLLNYIEEREDALKENVFCKWLEIQQDPTFELYSFAPYQYFMVLGFRDLLHQIKVENPECPHDEILNQHANEDFNHWLWYLGDLEKIGFELRRKAGISDIIRDLWRQEDFVMRDLIYTISYYIKLKKGSLFNLILIECLESAFKVFFGSLRKATSHKESYKILNYYGENHFEDESSHSYDVDPNVEISKELEELGFQAAKEIFDLYEQIFEQWLKRKASYLENFISLENVKVADQVAEKPFYPELQL